ncbi:MAG: DUF2934 domain-containing protein [Burkholderiales bacterium]|nr:DUF2934 domain-containing protein [Burkholderiales bacterium]
MVATGDGQAQAVGPQADSPREMRIREAAYALYLARGQAEGHDVDDWLAAEAALAGEAAAAEPKAAPLTH